MAQRRTTTRRGSSVRGRKPKKVTAFDIIIDKLRIYKDLASRTKSAKEQQDILRCEVVDFLLAEKDRTGAKGTTTIAGTDDYGARHQATLVEPTTQELDKAGLQAELTDEQWAQCHEYVFSEKRLEDLVARGVIPKEVVQKYITIVPSKPYPKIT